MARRRQQLQVAEDPGAPASSTGPAGGKDKGGKGKDKGKDKGYEGKGKEGKGKTKQSQALAWLEGEAEFTLEYYTGTKKGWVKYDQKFVDSAVSPLLQEGKTEINAWLWLAEWDTTYNLTLWQNTSEVWGGERIHRGTGPERETRGHWALAKSSGSG
ncbi:MAG: hypothetical protein GY772_00890, partial [bacterium]|nr:hypothetical protein [bacterium]